MYLAPLCHTPDVSLSSAHPQLSPTRTVAPLYATYPTICVTEALLHPDLLPFAHYTTCNLPNAANPYCHCTATLRPLRSSSLLRALPAFSRLTTLSPPLIACVFPSPVCSKSPESSYPPPGKVNKMRCHEPQSCCDPCHNRCSRAFQKTVSSLSPVCCFVM